MSTYHRRQRKGLLNALDEVRFGSQRTLNLRDSMPSAADATARAEAWLRERQVAASDEVLIITGRGKGSHDGIGVVHDAIHRLLGSLKRKGVVSDFSNHNQGSFVVTLAPVSMLLEAPRRHRGRSDTQLESQSPAALSALEPSTKSLLRQLAVRSLADLGTAVPDQFIDAEMLRQFSLLAAGVAPGHGGEERLRRAIAHAIDEVDEA
jgi:hypothetical protein